MQVQHKELQEPDPVTAAVPGGRLVEQNGPVLFPVQALKVLGRKEDAGQQTRTRGTGPRRGRHPGEDHMPYAVGERAGMKPAQSCRQGREQDGQGRLPFLLLV